MNKDAIFAFIKKNIVSLCCGVVAIVAIVLLFYPLGGMVDQLTTDASTRGNNYTTLSGYLKTRKEPVSDPYQADPGELPGQIPNTATIAAGKAAVEAWKHTSEVMLSNASKMNEQGHQMLVPDELPAETHETTPFHFAQVYRLVLSSDPTKTGIGDLTANPPVPPDPTLAEVKALNLTNDILHGGLPPTIEQITKAEQTLLKDVYEPRIITVNGKAMNTVQLTAEYKAETSLLPRKMKAEVARRYKIYVEKDAFAMNPAITTEQRSQIQDIWYAQMQLWMQQDLATAIADANSGSTNILDAMVKRLIMVQVPTPDKMYVIAPPAASANGGGGQGNQPAPGTDTTAYPPNYNVSVTGRYSNGMYDVVRFGLVVDVDASRVNQFIEALSAKRFITVTDENEYALDPEAEAERGYLYGSAPVVRLQLGGEMLFLRSWTTSLMPDAVKMYLGIIQPKPGMTPGMPPGPGPGPMGGMGGMGGMPPQFHPPGGH
jgi:hypothetical protein